jgi:uncharacterized tellurite resistance protein B-like protein
MNLMKLLGFGADEPKGEVGDGSVAGGSQAETEAVRKIAGQLRKLDPARARNTAAFAYILSRVATADSHIDEQETREMERIVREIGGLNEGQAALVVEMAKTHSMLFAGTDDFLVTREFEKNATREEKIALLGCLFAVGAADESISSEEESAIRQTASELRLGRDDYVAARSKYRAYLAVLKDPKR